VLDASILRRKNGRFAELIEEGGGSNKIGTNGTSKQNNKMRCRHGAGGLTRSGTTLNAFRESFDGSM
jgi:hypothetical protein